MTASEASPRPPESFRKASRIAAAAAAAGLPGLLTVGEYLLGVDLGLDTVLFRGTEGPTRPFPCRMASATRRERTKR